MISDELKSENEKKYGSKDNDLIAKIERLNPYLCAFFCASQKIKYETRLANDFDRGNDREKIYDYDMRLQTVCRKYNIPYFDCIEEYLKLKNIVRHVWKTFKK